MVSLGTTLNFSFTECVISTYYVFPNLFYIFGYLRLHIIGYSFLPNNTFLLEGGIKSFWILFTAGSLLMLSLFQVNSYTDLIVRINTE
jgi:hypothetical protein